MSLSLMNRQMMRVISSPSSSTIGWATLILGMGFLGRWRGCGSRRLRAGAEDSIGAPPRKPGRPALDQRGLDQGGGIRHRRRRFAGYAVEHLIDLRHHGEQATADRRGEALVDDVVDQPQQGLPIAVDV